MSAKILQSLFDVKNIPADAQKVLQNFDQIAQAALPANSKQLVALPKQIRELSHQMTDDRGSRRLGYMNEKTFLSAYIRYFVWWNLVRLTRLFANLDFGFLRDGDVCLDIGSGPMTLVCALWLACPTLRQKKLVWYALDISQAALARSLGISQQTLSSWEHGHTAPRTSTLPKIAEALDCSVADLLGENRSTKAAGRHNATAARG